MEPGFSTWTRIGFGWTVLWVIVSTVPPGRQLEGVWSLVLPGVVVALVAAVRRFRRERRRLRREALFLSIARLEAENEKLDRALERLAS
jgi:hypothetical protein